MKNIQQFFSTMSHEIKSPIANIITAVDFLKSENNCDADFRKQLINGIDQEARNALSILKNILYYLELDNKAFQQNMTSIHLADFFTKLTKQYATQSKAGVTFNCHSYLPHLINHVTFDFRHTFEVLNIIIENALKFTEQGSITLTAHLLISGSIRFILQDTGPGIPKAYLKNIFNTFLNTALSKNKKSYVKTGLKLTLARRIAELAGGSLNIKSKVNVGTIVYFDIPYLSLSFIENDRNNSYDAHEIYGELPYSKKEFFPFTVLLIEDDPITAFAETEALQRLGCKVLWVDTAAKAIESVQQHIFDLIFIDITLPDMTGVAWAEAVKPTLPKHTQLVALTSHTDDYDHDYFLRHGMMTMLAKPLTQDDFKRFFQGYLRVLDCQEE